MKKGGGVEGGEGERDKEKKKASWKRRGGEGRKEKEEKSG